MTNHSKTTKHHASEHGTGSKSKNEQDTKPCLFCAEPIKAEAKKCKHCGEILDEELRKEKQKHTLIHRKWSPGVAAVLSFFIPGAGQIYKGQIGNGLVWLVVTVLGYIFLIFPGVVLHICCIYGAAQGDPTK